MKTIYFAGGCFWGTQRFFDQFNGIKSTVVGYANGKSENPSYQDVCGGSGHAETVKVEYDETVLPTQKLIGYYFKAIDPLSVNQQGCDCGIQYRTGIYYSDETLLADIVAAVNEEKSLLGENAGKFAVEVKPLENFYPAEEYHQKYLVKNPNGYCHLPLELFCIAMKEKSAESSDRKN